MKHPSGKFSPYFVGHNGKPCETCLNAVQFESEMDLSDDPTQPTKVDAFVRVTPDGRKELVLSQPSSAK